MNNMFKKEQKKMRHTHTHKRKIFLLPSLGLWPNAFFVTSPNAQKDIFTNAIEC